MKFSGTQFSFGIAQIFINTIDTEKAVINGSVKIPMLNGHLWIRVIKSLSWNNTKKMSLELEWIENDPPKIDDEDDDEDFVYGDNDWEEDNA